MKNVRVGDKLVLRKDLEVGKDYGGVISDLTLEFFENMKILEGNKIEEVNEKSVLVSGAGVVFNGYYYTYEMLDLDYYKELRKDVRSIKMSRLYIRVWDKTRNEYLSKEFVETFQFRLFKSDFYIFEQYTGLRDKNGKDIYEGDILTDDYENYVVEYDVEEARYIISSKTITESLGNVNYDIEFRVIGNINENKELLG